MSAFPGLGVYLRGRRLVNRVASRVVAPFRHYDVSIFHEFTPPPAGGGHQFLRALMQEWQRVGVRVEVNQISASTSACLFNSYNFDVARLRYLRRPGCRMVHRVDGPLCVYRGFDDGTDRQIADRNREFADATVMQSQFSLQAHQELGLGLIAPVVIPNAADPDLFYPTLPVLGTHDFKERKVRIVSASWSDNPNKGADVYQWLDRNLDFSRYAYTFAGRIGVKLRNIRVVPPLPSAELAGLLRGHDIFLTASKHDPCSNSVIEAMACGLPVLYLKSGGHPELVRDGGLGFDKPDEIPLQLQLLIGNYEGYRSGIPKHDIRVTAKKYLNILLGSSGIISKGEGVS